MLEVVGSRDRRLFDDPKAVRLATTSRPYRPWWRSRLVSGLGRAAKTTRQLERLLLGGGAYHHYQPAASTNPSSCEFLLVHALQPEISQGTRSIRVPNAP